MEPVVLLNANSVPKCAERKASKRRGKNKRKLFSKKKYYHMKTGLPPTSMPSFMGWGEENDKATTDFHGFNDSEIEVSASRTFLNAYEGLDLITTRSTVYSISPDNDFVYSITVQPIFKRKLACLSLFDGIASCLVTLQRLGIEIGIYFSCEIDSDALTVQRENFPGQIVALGSVKKLDDEFLHSLGRIDFCAAGPPCEDLSLLNAKRREFHDPESSAWLIMDLKRIRDFFSKKMYQNNCNFMWFMETTSHQRSECKQRISEELKALPNTICASSFGCVFRKRDYYSNIPGLRELALEKKGQVSHKSLQSVLGAYRVATIKYAHCITSNTSLQNKPVLFNGIPTNLTINELELLQSLPQHFTDVNSLSVRQRTILLARSWHIDVICAIFLPLKDIFLSCI